MKPGQSSAAPKSKEVRRARGLAQAYRSIDVDTLMRGRGKQQNQLVKTSPKATATINVSKLTNKSGRNGSFN